jgi:hypothetical protein
MSRACRIFWTVSIMALAAGVIGCGGSTKLPAPAERLPGKWHGEMIIYEESQQKLPAEQVAALSQMQYDFEFRPDGTMALSGVNAGKAFTSEGHWQPVKQDGDTLTITSTEQSGSKKDVQIEFDGKDTFYIPVTAPPTPGAQMAELGAMRFTRFR